LSYLPCSAISFQILLALRLTAKQKPINRYDIKEHRGETMVTIPPELRESLKKGECVLLAGAGLSKGLPQWTELVKPLAEELGISPDIDPRKIASYYEVEKGRKTLEDKIVLRLRRDVPLTETHRLLANLPLKAIITTNYDNLLERALSQRNYVKIVDGREAPLAGQDQVSLIKMHGDLETPSTIIITQKDYDGYPENHRALIQYVMGFLISCNFLFVGYSLNDQSFHIMYAQARSLFEKSMRRSFAIFKNPPPLEVKRLEKESNITVIPVEDYDRDIPEIFRELHEYCSGRRPSQLTALDIQDIRRAFCGVVKSQNEWLDPRGIFQFDHMLTKGEVALEEVYVVPRLQKQIQKRRSRSIAEEKVIEHEEYLEKQKGLKNLGDIRKSLASERALEASAEGGLELEEYVFEQEVELSLEDALSDTKNNHMVILGDPGIGKSCLLQYIALKASTDPKSLGVNIPLLPVILPLREYKKFGQDKMLREFLFHYVKNRICALTEELEELLEKNMFFLLLDGLDEVISESERIQVSRQVEQFMARYKDTRIILTSRPSGYKTARLIGAVPHFRLAEFNDAEIRDFLVKWFSYLDQIEKEFDLEKVEEKADKLKDKILKREKIVPLARNPLLLTILVLVHRVGKELPERRAEFYEHAVRTVAGTWERWKNLHPDRRIPDEETILRILEKVGFDLHKDRPENVVKKDLLKKWLDEALREEKGHSSSDEVEDFIWMLDKRAGLLVEKGLELYGFVHLTFQEYFAARHIAIGRGTGQAGSLIRKYLYKSRWKEVFLLAAGIAPPEQADLIFSSILEAENLFENYIHSNVLFAGEALADQPRLSNSRRKSVIDRLIGLTSPNYIDLLRLDGLEMLGKIRKVFEFPDDWAFELLKDEDPYVRREAVEYFAKTGAGDEQVTSRFFELLKDEYPDVRWEAVKYFAETGAGDEQVTSRIFELLKDEDPDVRWEAVRYFAETGTGDKQVTSRIFELLKDEYPDVRWEAVRYFAETGTGDKQVTSRIFELLKDEYPDVRWEAVKYFARTGAGDKQVTSRIFELLKDEDPDVRWEAVKYFAETGAGDKQVTSKFFELLKDKNPYVRREAVKYFAETGAGDKQVTSRIFELLKDEYPYVRREAVEYFARTGAGDEQVTSKFFELLKDEDPDVRWEAVEYFAKTGAGDEQVTSRFFELLKDEYPDVRWEAVKYFAETGAGDEQVTSRIFELLKDEDPDVRWEAVRYFAETGTGDKQVTSRIFELLKDEYPDVRWEAVRYFAETGTGDKQVTSRIFELLKDEYPYVRREAVEYFARTGAGDEQVTSKFFELLEDESSNPFLGKTNQQIAIDYLSKYVKDESSRKASRLFQEGDYSLKRGAYKLMKALLASE
jgi:HEAT repeat protein